MAKNKRYVAGNTGGKMTDLTLTGIAIRAGIMATIFVVILLLDAWISDK